MWDKNSKQITTKQTIKHENIKSLAETGD